MQELRDDPQDQEKEGYPTPQAPAPTSHSRPPRNCEICHQEFTPSKYRPAQKVCSRPECQKERQRQNILSWRDRNPAYFRHIHANPHWRNKRSLRSRQWRLAHPEHIREYRKTHREYYRLYMREYMRQYRKRRAASGEATAGKTQR